jgi:leader peptidase (prepilin peptidase)/N-methyltransferase
MRSLTLVVLPGAAVLVASWIALDPMAALVSCLLGWTMLAIAVTDAERFIVPDILSLPAIPAGLIAIRVLAGSELDDGLVFAHIGAAVAGAASLYAIRQLYFYWRGREGLGLGDVKLAAAAGAWTGLSGLGHVLLLACVLAISYVFICHARNLRNINGSAAVPLGLFLAPSIWLVWFAAASGFADSLPVVPGQF